MNLTRMSFDGHLRFPCGILFVLLLLIVTPALEMQTVNAQAGKLGSIKLLEKMQKGMKYDEVVGILGRPKRVGMASDLLLARWKLHEIWVGYHPYDFVFNPADSTLIMWEENEKDWEKQQDRLKLIAEGLEEMSKAVQAVSSGGDVPVPNDPQLMQQFAATYYSFSAVGGGQTGGTERRIILCANGQYRQSSESGYSGDAGSAGAWGTASQGGGGGTWSIQGNLQNGTISTTDSKGKTTNYNYSSCGNGCYMFGSNKFAYEGPSGC